MRDPALVLFDDPAECAPASMRTLGWLMRHGVSPRAATTPWCVCGAYVSFAPDAPLYEPRPIGTAALIFAIIGHDGIIDAAAWAPSLGKIGTRFGTGAMLGEGQIGHNGLGTTELPIPVWRTPLAWLKADRHGVVIVDEEVAAHRLAGCLISGEDATHNAELRRALTVAPPAIAPVHREYRHAA